MVLLNRILLTFFFVQTENKAKIINKNVSIFESVTIEKKVKRQSFFKIKLSQNTTKNRKVMETWDVYFSTCC